MSEIVTGKKRSEKTKRKQRESAIFKNKNKRGGVIMVDVIYLGERPSIRICVYNKYIDNWAKGEVKILSDKEAEKLLRENNDFSLVKKEKKVEKVKKQEEKPKEKKLKFDLDGDGVVDRKDAQIAGQVLANYRKNKYKD